MSTNAVGVWERAIKLLQDAARDPTNKPLQDSIIAQGLHLKHMPPPPKSTWKKLVQQLQVCTSTSIEHGCCLTLLLLPADALFQQCCLMAP
jgi:hypothetical protein